MIKKIKITDIQKIIGKKKIEIGLVLGSGLGKAIPLKKKLEFEYNEIKGFNLPSVTGHSGKLLIGTIHNRMVAVLSGRTHFYENGKADTMRNPIKLLKDLGVEKLVLTNASGSLRKNIPTGSLMVIEDHINFSGLNPLIGENSEDRFVNLTVAYDKDISEMILKAGNEQNINIKRGIYAWFSGPSFETPAEIKAIRSLGADVVGMSTVPEVIVANHCDLPVVAISVITNLAAGMNKTKLSHQETLENASLAEKNILQLIKNYINEVELNDSSGNN